MTAMVWPRWPELSVRFDRARRAWGIQDSAPGAAEGRWIDDQRYKLFTEAYSAKERLRYQSSQAQAVQR